MTATVQRVADLRLRSSAGPARTRVWWPLAPDPATTTGLLLFFTDAGVEVQWLRELASLAQLVVVAAPCAPGADAVVRASRRDATTALEWAGDHARQLEADPARLLVGGIGIGAALADAAAQEAAARGWPPLTRRLLVPLDAAPPEAADHGAPATVVTVGGAEPWPAGPDDEELAYDELDGARLAADLAHTLRACGSSSAIRRTGAWRSSSSTTRSM
jgi:alpha/beta hydrolase fold